MERTMDTEANKTELRELLNKYKFLRALQFTRWAEVNNSSVNMFARGERNSMPKLEEYLKFCKRVLSCK